MRLMRMFICFDLIILLLGIYTKGIIPKKKHAMHTKTIITVFLTIFKLEPSLALPRKKTHVQHKENSNLNRLLWAQVRVCQFISQPIQDAMLQHKWKLNILNEIECCGCRQ